MKTPETCRILIVDDHASVRHALALVLEEEGFRHCREARGLSEALDAAGFEPPDIVLVDLSVEQALDLVENLSARRIPVLVCSISEDPPSVRHAMAAGARGYITKVEAPEKLAQAVRAVLEGWMLISPQAAAGLR